METHLRTLDWDGDSQTEHGRFFQVAHTLSQERWRRAPLDKTIKLAQIVLPRGVLHQPKTWDRAPLEGKVNESSVFPASMKLFKFTKQTLKRNRKNWKY